MKNFLVVLALMLNAAGRASAQSADETLILVNGNPVTRTQVIQRMWTEHANNTLEILVKEELVRQAITKNKIKPNKKEIDSRIRRLKDRFENQAAFEASLERSRTTLDAIRAQIQEQVQREDLVKKAKKLKVSNKDLKQFFEENKARLGRGEQIRIRHILVGSKQKADDLLLAIRAGAKFEALAREASLDTATKGRGGDLGYISKGILAPEIEKEAFAMKPGSVSEVISTQRGFHLLYVEDKRPPKDAEFKEIKDDLKRAMLADRVTKAWPAYLEELQKEAKLERAK